MLGRRRRAPVAGYVVEDGAHLVQHPIPLRQMSPLLEGDPSALVFAIATLHLLVHALLHFALEDTGSGGLIVVGYLEDVGSVDPVVCPAAHDMIAVHIALVDGDLGCVSGERYSAGRKAGGGPSTHIAVCRRIDLAIGRRGHFHHSIRCKWRLSGGRGRVK